STEGPRRLILSLFQSRKALIDLLQGLCDFSLVFSCICAQFQVLEDSKVREHSPALRHMRHTHGYDLMSRNLRDIFSLKKDLSLFCLQHTGDRLQRCGLARAVGAD